MRKKLSIAIVSPAFFPDIGGAQVTLHHLATYLTEKDHRVLVMIPLGKYLKIWKIRKLFSYPIIPMLPYRFQMSGVINSSIWLSLQKFQLWLLQKIFRFDVWQSFYSFPSGILISQFTKKNNLPHILRCVGDDIQVDTDIGYGIREDSVIDGFVREYLPKIDMLVALSQSVIEEFHKIGVTNEHIVEIPCGVSWDRFQKNVDRKLIRATYKIDNEAFTFITVGRNHPKKGFDLLVKALKILLDDGYSKAVAVFVGADMEPLTKLASELNITENVIITGELGVDYESDDYDPPNSKLVDLYKACDACAFPSLIETFAMIYIEAMAAGIPVIGTDAPGCKEILEDDVNGLIAVAGNVESLASKMKIIMDNNNLRKYLVRNGTTTVHELYRWSVVGKQYESAYFNLINNKN
jgi:glycosyltransferase involved in cell wall biosynthesis